MTAEREAMTLERQAFVQWLETLQTPIPTTTEVERAWQGYQAAWQYVREKADFAARMTERISADLPCATEPVAYGLFTKDGLIRMWSKKWFGEVSGKSVDPTPLYTHPPEPARDAKRWQTLLKMRKADLINVLKKYEPAGRYKNAGEAYTLQELVDAAMAQESGDGNG